jgi:hypothetical protein
LLLSDELDAERQQQQHLVQFLLQQRTTTPIDTPSPSYYEQYIQWHIAHQVSPSLAVSAHRVAQQLQQAITVHAQT